MYSSLFIFYFLPLKRGKFPPNYFEIDESLMDIMKKENACNMSDVSLLSEELTKRNFPKTSSFIGFREVPFFIICSYSTFQSSTVPLSEEKLTPIRYNGRESAAYGRV